MRAKHGASAPARPRNGHETGDARARKPLREVVCEIDRDILRLLLRRNNILVRMRGDKPRLDPTEEKTIRESWEAAVSHISRDARLSGHFFSLMQEVEFQPRPASAALTARMKAANPAAQQRKNRRARPLTLRRRQTRTPAHACTSGLPGHARMADAGRSHRSAPAYSALPHE